MSNGERENPVDLANALLLEEAAKKFGVRPLPLEKQLNLARRLACSMRAAGGRPEQVARFLVSKEVQIGIRRASSDIKDGVKRYRTTLEEGVNLALQIVGEAEEKICPELPKLKAILRSLTVEANK